MNPVILEIKQIGDRLALYIPRKILLSLNLKKGDNIKIIIKKGKNSYELFSKFNYLISLTRDSILNLNLKKGEEVNIYFEKLQKNPNSNSLFNKGKIDLLFLIPNKTSKENEIVIDELEENSDRWLKIKSFHNRGSSKLIKLKRFVDPYILGCFLGQLQSEGTKSFNEKLEFCNKSLQEHLDFVESLIYLGTPKQKILAKLDCDKDMKNIEEEIFKFQNKVGLNVKYIGKSSISRNGFGFKSFVRSTIFAELILFFMDSLRDKIKQDIIEDNMVPFADGFIAKVLNGDGTIYIINRGNHRILQARLSIADGNYNYLEDYKKILEKYGLKPHINKKQKCVRSYLNYQSAKKLLSIGAFNNNPNHEKLILFINNLEAHGYK